LTRNSFTSYLQKLMIMSSFLMNSGSYVDPKFLTGEDYAQSGYVHHSGGDYYGHQTSVQYPAYPVNSQTAALTYGSREAAAMGYSTYYQQCGISPHQQAMHMAAAGHLSNPIATNSSHLGHSINRSPASSPTPVTSSTNTQNSHHHPQQQSQPTPQPHLGYHSPQGSTPQPQTTPGNDGMSSDCSDDDSSPQACGGQMPVVYPWMKKIHVAGAGTLL
jgi:hypothetical protein